MEYNEEQKEAIRLITAFILDNNITNKKQDYFYVLEGFAGTGKTTIIKEVLSNIKNKKKVVVSAPTHRAKEVIQNFTKETAETIQSLLGLRPDTELEFFNPNKPQFGIIAEEKIKNYKVLIIDEASMINKSLKILIEEKAIEYKVTVIYIGDIYQLPPIGERVSEVFITYKNKSKLNTIVRQKDSNPNNYLIELARNDVKNDTDTLYNHIKSIKNSINEKTKEGYKILNKDDYYFELLNYYLDSEYKHNNYLIKTLCWTNNLVNQTNLFIRNKLTSTKELVTTGDIFMGYKTIMKEVPFPPFNIITVKNSVEYIVKTCYISTQRINGIDLKGYKTYFEDSNQDSMFILHKDSYETFKETYKYLLYNAKQNRKWKPFYNFKNEIVLLEDIRYGINNNDIVSKDINYGYAITVHKAQGTTFDNCAVTLTNILKNPNQKERRQLAYVALSRAKYINLIYG